IRDLIVTGVQTCALPIFGEPVALSEIYRVLQEVPGVDSVDIDEFQFKDQTAAFLIDRGATADPIQRTLRIFSARPNPAPPPPAEIGRASCRERVWSWVGA